MILCDTNILIEFYKDTKTVIYELHKIGQQSLAVSVITQAELYLGAINRLELQKIRQHISLLSVIPIDSSVCMQFISLMEQYSLSHKLTIPDALIASTALVHKMEIYTLNDKDFRFIRGLRLYNPKTY